jgi:hypothetical protein
MNRIYKALLIGASIIALAASCSEFLEVNPRTDVSEAEFYSDEESMMKGLYAVINEAQTRLPEVWSYSSLLGDESETGGGIGEGQWKYKWDNFTYGPTSCFGEYDCGSWWNEWDYGLYNGVIAACLLIDKLNESSLPASFVDPIMAEAKFYRALFYYYLWMGYEQIPLIKNYIKASEMYNIHKGTRDEVFNFMLEDLSDDVTKHLPGRKATAQGRVCKEVAKLLRAKIILFHRSSANYETAYNDMTSIISSKTFSLHPDYTKIWLKEGEWCDESMFEICYAGGNSGEGFNLAHSLSGRSIVDPRSAEQGGLYNGYGQNTMPSTVYNMFKDGDTRREGTIIVYADELKKVQDLVAAGELPAGSTFAISEEQENYEGLGHYKLHARKESTSSVNPDNNHFNSWRIYRYADVLLIAVELEARMNNGTVSAQAQGWFDQIRDRAFGDQNHRISLSGKTQQEVLDIIFEERGYEFIDEMQRWFDIMRFDKGAEILSSKGWTEKYRYFPICQSEIDKSKGGLTQNDAWK